MISTNQIHYFLTVAEVCNMSKAAEILYISQPSLSSAISRMESELHCSLFDRIGGNRIVLNKCGRQLYVRFKALANDYVTAIQEINDINDVSTGLIRFSTPDIAMIEDPLQAYMLEHRNNRIVHYCYSVSEIANTKFVSELDFSLNYAPSDDRKLDWEPIIEQPIYAIVGDANPHYTQDCISPAQLAAQSIAIYCHNDEFPSICHRLISPYGISHDAFAGGSLKMMMSYVLDTKNTIALIPGFQYMVLRKIIKSMVPENRNYRLLRIDDRSFDIQIGVITLRGSYISKASMNLLNYLKSEISQVGMRFEKDTIIVNEKPSTPIPIK